jgi:G8 domain
MKASHCTTTSRRMILYGSLLLLALYQYASTVASLRLRNRTTDATHRRHRRSNNNTSTTSHQPFVHHHRRSSSLLMDNNNNNGTVMTDFVPLSCNNNNNSVQPCVTWSTVFGTDSVYDTRVTVPCGTCVTMDQPFVTFLAGLDIQGKLLVALDTGAESMSTTTTIQATLIVVQGELEMTTSNKHINGTPAIKIILIGEHDEYFQPVHENANACGGTACLAGQKGLVVAGGRVNST